MPKVRRIYYESACYHVCARGNNRRYIFEKDEAKIKFLSILSHYQNRMGMKVYAMVLMGNHFHLLLSVRERFGISRLMQGILLSFSHWYRKNELYIGHVWPGRFVSRLVMHEKQLVENIKYIHENPVRANLVEDPLRYRWSTAWILNSNGRSQDFNFEGLRISEFLNTNFDSLGGTSLISYYSPMAQEETGPSPLVLIAQWPKKKRFPSPLVPEFL